MKRLLTKMVFVFLVSVLSANSIFPGETRVGKKQDNTALEIAPATASPDVAAAAISSVSGYYMNLDGENVCKLNSFDGGAISAEVINDYSNEGIPEKTLGAIDYGDVIIQFAPNSSTGGGSFLDWIFTEWNGGSQSLSEKDMEIIATDKESNIVMKRVSPNAQITGASFPTLEASSNSKGPPLYITVGLSPGNIEIEEPSGKLTGFSSGSSKGLATNRFSLSINGIDCSKVTKIDSFSFTKGTSTPSRSLYSNLKVTLDDPNPSAWISWQNSLIQNSDNEKSSGTLSFKNLSNQTVASISFNQLGICSITPPNTSKSNKTVVELYYESIELQQ